MNPKISIIIPVYNSEHYLEKCLDSVFRQSYTDYEVIIVNDGSVDNSLSICKQYSTKSNKFLLIDQKNQGVDSARNNALDICTGDYVTFLDSDDFADADWLQGFADAVNQYPMCDMVVEGLLVDYEYHIKNVVIDNNIYIGKDIISAYRRWKGSYIEGFLFNKLYKRSIITDKNIRFEYTLKEDLLFNLKFLLYSDSVVSSSVSSYHYLQRGAQSLIHKRYPIPYMERLITGLKNAGVALAQKYSDDSFRSDVIEEYMLSYSVMILSMYRKNTLIIERNDRIQYIKEYQRIRRENNTILIRIGGMVKRILTLVMMAPPCIVDFFFSVAIQKNPYIR